MFVCESLRAARARVRPHARVFGFVTFETFLRRLWGGREMWTQPNLACTRLSTMTAYERLVYDAIGGILHVAVRRTVR